MNTIRHILQIKGSDVWSIDPESTVYEALRRMADKGVGALLVMDKDQLIGILSERDYARKIILFNKSSRETLVREIMTSEVFTIHPDQTVHECMDLMTQKRIRHVPVLEDQHVLGVISIGDVVKDLLYHQRQTIRNLEERIISKDLLS
jgi:CBS domain-containing protein